MFNKILLVCLMFFVYVSNIYASEVKVDINYDNKVAIENINTLENGKKFVEQIDEWLKKYNEKELIKLLTILPKIENNFKGKNNYIYNYFEIAILKNISKSNKEHVYSYSKQQTLGKYLNPLKDIPVGKFKAHYINTNNPKKLVSQEYINSNISTNFSFSKDGISLNDFGSYYVGYFDFNEREIRNIQYDLSWSNVRIVIDGKEVISQTNKPGDFDYIFQKGRHKIEVEYINNWHTTGLFINFNGKNNVYSFKEFKNIIKDDVTDDTKILYFGVYESSNEDNNISVDLNYIESPAIVVLSSYDPIIWNVNYVTDNITAIVYSSYKKGGYVTVDSKVDIYNVEDIKFEHKLKPTYSDINGRLHYGNYGISKLNVQMNKLFGKNVYGFNGGYALQRGILPKEIITEEKLKEYMQIYVDIEKTHRDKTKTIKELYDNSANNTWGSHLNISNEIPTGSYKAFYIDSTKADNLVSTENIDNISLDFAHKFKGVTSENFGAYYVGYFDFDEDITKELIFKISRSELRITIDGEEVILSSSKGGNNYFFNKGRHKIEIEYLNNWHTSNFNFKIK